MFCQEFQQKFILFLLFFQFAFKEILFKEGVNYNVWKKSRKNT